MTTNRRKRLQTFVSRRKQPETIFSKSVAGRHSTKMALEMRKRPFEAELRKSSKLQSCGLGCHERTVSLPTTLAPRHQNHKGLGKKQCSRRHTLDWAWWINQSRTGDIPESTFMSLSCHMSVGECTSFDFEIFWKQLLDAGSPKRWLLDAAAWKNWIEYGCPPGQRYPKVRPAMKHLVELLPSVSQIRLIIPYNIIIDQHGEKMSKSCLQVFRGMSASKHLGGSLLRRWGTKHFAGHPCSVHWDECGYQWYHPAKPPWLRDDLAKSLSSGTVPGLFLLCWSTWLCMTIYSYRDM